MQSLHRTEILNPIKQNIFLNTNTKEGANEFLLPLKINFFIFVLGIFRKSQGDEPKLVPERYLYFQNNCPIIDALNLFNRY